ncbi:uncharacterized protein N7503_003948, partial [Penicillium pulvis]|uniref:uncharacterized protein n=1 Tax=Penicillium pulvis TaxID=1562058 RepID=UPI002547519A
GAIFGAVLVASGNGWSNCNSGVTGQWADKGPLDVQCYGWKGIRFWPQKASKAVIFGVNPTGRIVVLQGSGRTRGRWTSNVTGGKASVSGLKKPQKQSFSASIPQVLLF